MADLKKGAQALFFEHYGDLLRSGLPPTEALARARADWSEASDGVVRPELVDEARNLLVLIDKTGKALHAESVTANVERIKVLKGVRLGLLDLIEMEESS